MTTSNPFRCDIVEGFETELMNFGTGTFFLLFTTLISFHQKNEMKWIKPLTLDLPHFTGNHKSYLFGPGSIHVSHTKDEFLSKFNLAHGISDYKVLIKNVLAQEKNIKNNWIRLIPVLDSFKVWLWLKLWLSSSSYILILFNGMKSLKVELKFFELKVW